jgi:protein TonB
MFEQSVLRKQKGRRWGWPLVAAVVTHAVGLAVVVATVAWGVDAVEPPPDWFPRPLEDTIPVILETPRGAPAPPVPAPPTTTAAQPPAVVTQPPTVPDAPPDAPLTTTAAPVDATVLDLLANTGEGGDGTSPDGLPWGTGTGEGESDEPVIYDARMAPPVALTRVSPRYPETARIAGRQGLVVVLATIDRSGRVTDVKVVKPLGLGCDEAAVAAVQQWRFRPATLAGRPVPVYFQLSVTFSIRH